MTLVKIKPCALDFDGFSSILIIDLILPKYKLNKVVVVETKIGVLTNNKD
jgi:hypothetical protein